MDYKAVSTALENLLSLRMTPIALKFVKEEPAEVPRTDVVVPSACAFWRRAETEVFYAAAEDHFNCPLGAMIMGFPLPDKQQAQLQDELRMMFDVLYVREEEVEHVPKMEETFSGAVYGPLKCFPLRADAVLIWLTPQQAMMMSECCGLINWAAPPTGVLGRPGCASIPAALKDGSIAQSLGCVGMRRHTDIPAELLLMAIPGNRLDELIHDLHRTWKIHHELEEHYAKKVAMRPVPRARSFRPDRG